MRVNLPDIRQGMTSTSINFPPPGTVASDWTSQGEEPGTRRDQYMNLLTYDQDIGDWNLTTKLAYNTDESNNAFDLDHTEQRPFQGLFAMYSEIDRDDHSPQ